MKASEYLERKRARKGKPHWTLPQGGIPSGVYAGESGFIMCGTTADIDTPEKREAIAGDAMARLAAMMDRDK